MNERNEKDDIRSLDGLKTERQSMQKLKESQPRQKLGITPKE